MWWTSRASPVSTTRPTCVRVRSRTRWWWTAAVSSSDGIGASSVVEFAVGEDDQVGAVGDRRGHVRADVVDRRGQRPAALGRRMTGLAGGGDREEAVDDERLEPRRLAELVDVHQLGQVVVVDDRPGQDDLAARPLRRLEQVALRPDRRRQRGHQLLADGVERRVRHLGEELGEVVVEQARPLGEDGDRRRRSPSTRSARRPVLAIGPTMIRSSSVVYPNSRWWVTTLACCGVSIDRAGRSSSRTWSSASHSAYGCSAASVGLDLVVVDDPALGRVDQEHPAGLEPALADDGGRVEVEHADLGGQHDEAVVGHPVAGRPQPVAVEHGADDGAVGEGDGGRAVPRLHQRRVVAVERPAGRVHRLVVLPGLGDHHQHRVRQAAGRRGAAARAPRRRMPSRSPRACRSGRSARGRRG